MQSTLEVRWFLPGSVPDDISHWFHLKTPEVSPLEQREDWYLRLPQHPDLGIKLRQGRLEIKQQLDGKPMQALEDSPMFERMGGQVERWQKWSFALQAGDAEYNSLSIEPGTWIAVEKSRLLKTYHLTPAQTLVPTAATEEPSPGCDVEIAQIRALGQVWFSLGFEAFGNPADLESVLGKTLQQVLPPSSFPCLTADNACSYPRWLGRLQSAEPTR